MMVLRQPFVVGLGEVLWDLLPSGPQLGGAPANFACHASQLGGRGALVSSVGEDELGLRAIEAIGDFAVDTATVSRCSLPTGTVKVALDQQGQATYEIVEHVAWDQIVWSTQLAKLAGVADAVCFGTLCQRSATSKATVHRFVQSVRRDALRVFDVNLREPHFDAATVRQSIDLANVVKVSDEELPVVADCCGLIGSETEMLETLRTGYDLRLVAMTCGARGAVLVDSHEVSQQHAYPIELADSVGAGDAYAAALTIGLLRGEDLPAINDYACRIAAFVCSCVGATPRLPEEYKSWQSADEDANHVGTDFG
ncbi:MAG: carbohydrate kinase [Planctomycetota bacterium]